MRMSVVVLSMCIAVAPLGSAGGQQAPAPSVPDGVLALLRTIVLDSLAAAGRRPGQSFVAGDSATGALLVAAHLDRDTAPAALPVCPRGTTKSGASVAAPVGFVISLTLQPVAKPVGWHLKVMKNCQMVERGKTDPHEAFGQGGEWAIRQVARQWAIVRTTKKFLTPWMTVRPGLVDFPPR